MNPEQGEISEVFQAILLSWQVENKELTWSRPQGQVMGKLCSNYATSLPDMILFFLHQMDSHLGYAFAWT